MLKAKPTSTIRPTKHIKRYIPFTTDYGFRATFGNEHDTTFLRKALAVLIGKPNPLQTVIFGKNTMTGIAPEARAGIYDLSCKDERGQEFLVEMQVLFYPSMPVRLKFYLMLKMQEHAKKGRYEFSEMPKMFGICFLGFYLFSGSNYVHRACIRDEKGNIVDNQTEYIYMLNFQNSRKKQKIAPRIWINYFLQ